MTRGLEGLPSTSPRTEDRTSSAVHANPSWFVFRFLCLLVGVRGVNMLAYATTGGGHCRSGCCRCKRPKVRGAFLGFDSLGIGSTKLQDGLYNSARVVVRGLAFARPGANPSKKGSQYTLRSPCAPHGLSFRSRPLPTNPTAETYLLYDIPIVCCSLLLSMYDNLPSGLCRVFASGQVAWANSLQTTSLLGKVTNV